MHGREFITLANTLLDGGTEAEHRTAVSRAYYAAFHTAKAFVTSLQFHISEGPQGHGELVRNLRECGVHSITPVGSQLGSLKTERNDVDYHLQKAKFCGPRSRDNSTKSVRTAEKIIEKIDGFAASKEHSKEVQKGIKAYLDKMK